MYLTQKLNITFDNTLHWNKHRNLFAGLRSTDHNPDDG
jgi:hypothetical protein